MKDTTITLLGNFGTQNLGNESTLQAMIDNLGQYLPGLAINCICPGPEEVTAAYGIGALLMSYRYGRAFLSRPARRRTPIASFFRRLLIRLPSEIIECLKAFRALKHTRALIMTGTGMLGDFGIGPLDLHYEILKWTFLAKLRRRPVLFVSVGAGPLNQRLSRWIVKRALSLADYRSYRDVFSKQFLDGIRFDTSRDRVYPDLAFSLPKPAAQGPPRPRRRSRVVGLGLMEYYGRKCDPRDGKQIYQDYVGKVARFTAWLLDRGYCVRLLVGDLCYDKRVKDDLVAHLATNGPSPHPGQLIDEPLHSKSDLCSQLAETDLVVATRFHNIVLALMLDKPVLALSYHEKVPSLMQSFGLADYCQSIAEMDVPILMERFTRLEQSADLLRPCIARRIEESRQALDEQYRLMARLLQDAPGVRCLPDGCNA